MSGTTVVRQNLEPTCNHQPNCGCQYAPCCFECPLPDCKYNLGCSGGATLGGEVGILFRLERIDKVVELRRTGLSQEAIGERLGIHRQTVAAYLRKAEEE